MQRDMKTSGRAMGWLFYGKHYGSYVTGLYLFTKVQSWFKTFMKFSSHD